MENIEKCGMTCIECVHYLACSAKGGLFNEKDDSNEMLCRFFFNKRDCAKVVRCEDCIYCENMKCAELKDNTGHPLDVAIFDYCSQGVRK